MKTKHAIRDHLYYEHHVPCSYGYDKWGHVYWACCEQRFRSFRQFLNHVSEVHKVQIIYEKGLLHRTVFLDGVTKNRIETESTVDNKLWS